jgi:hypothetical protein
MAVPFWLWSWTISAHIVATIQQQGASNIEIEGSGSLVMMLSLASARPLIASEDFDAEVKERMR